MLPFSHLGSSHSCRVFFFFLAHFYFPASGQAVDTGVVPFPPRFLPLIFIAHLGSALPLLVDFSSNVANSRSRAFRQSICAQEKVPTNLYECALGGARTHDTDLYQARGYPGTPPRRPLQVFVGVLVRLNTCKWLTNSLPKLSLIALSPPETAG